MEHLESRRILLTRMKYIGDVVLTTPVLRSVRNAYPGAYIAYLGEREAVSLLEHNPNINEVIGFDFARPGFFEQPRVAWLLRRRRFDLVIDFFSNPRSALLSYLTGANVRVGLDRSGRGSLYTIRVKDDSRPKTAIEFHNQFIRAVGIEPTATKTEIYLTDDERREARIYLRWLDTDSALRDTPKPVIGIHPGATWPAKQWSAERFAELANRMTSAFGAQVILTAGPRDGDTVRHVLQHSKTTNIKVIQNLPLRQLAAIVSHCAVYITNDNGTMHIAVGVGTPTIGIFGPGEENIWFPYNTADGHYALRKDVACHPCHLDFCNREGSGFMECMSLLTVPEVFETVQRIMEAKLR